MAPPGVHTSAPALGSWPPQAAVVPRPTAGPPEARGPRGLYVLVCPQPAPARRHPEPVCKRNWTLLGAEVQGGTHQAPFLGAGCVPDLRASAGLTRPSTPAASFLCGNASPRHRPQTGKPLSPRRAP